MKASLLALFVGLLMVGCGEDKQVHIDQDQAGELSNNVYHNKRVGWAMKIPEGWDIMSKETTDGIFSTGKNLGEDAGVEIDYAGTKTLLSLKKAEMSLGEDTFLSITQNRAIEENDRIGFVDGQKQLLLSVLRNQGGSQEASDIRSETIDGVSFQKFDIKTNGVGQTYYFTFFDDYYFGSILTYSSIGNREELFKVWRGSKFRQ